MIEVGVFTANVAEDIRRFLATRKGVKGLILDYKIHPVGSLMRRSKCQISFLQQAALFQPLGVIDAPMMSVTLVHDSSFSDLPVIVLQGSKTASAAEIVVAALKENQRARVAGQRSYGKGSVQTIFDPE